MNAMSDPTTTEPIEPGGTYVPARQPEERS
ncbi:hypothetical protein SAMN05421811_1272 [Nonomuraea wenchangensis]|uniref:Uncharacterized protein n=1 Tax=Nonomuraea wenchangensis TaxID=568860 RepID=A0A1I0LTE3_9ACTN|nr:hypothetical protein SAMN05421811_1272 [Nonomuraea wenchangensis]